MQPDVDPFDPIEPESLLTPGEVAVMFRVTPKTVTRWAEAGRLPVVRTLGGHRRFPASAVLRLRIATPADPIGILKAVAAAHRAGQEVRLPHARS